MTLGQLLIAVVIYVGVVLVLGMVATRRASRPGHACANRLWPSVWYRGSAKP